MRPGGGKHKGSAFERDTGRKLSLWISEGERGDIFARNVLSGGSFTNAVKKNSDEMGLPGDLAANHPIAFLFLQLFSVECKHKATLNFEAMLFDYQGTTFLPRTHGTSQNQAQRIGCEALVIARQNRRPTVLLCGPLAAAAWLAGVGARTRFQRIHWLHGQQLAMFDFEILLAQTKASRVLAHARQTWGKEAL